MSGSVDVVVVTLVVVDGVTVLFVVVVVVITVVVVVDVFKVVGKMVSVKLISVVANVVETKGSLKKKRQKKLNFFELRADPPPFSRKVKNSLFKLDLL